MEVFEAIKKRATYRGPFKKDVIPRENLIKIVNAGIFAPSGCNAQSTSFIIVDDIALMKKLATIIPKGGMDTAPAAIVVLSSVEAVYQDMQFYKEDYAAAVENIYLTATALGYATCWLDGVLRRDNVAKQISRLLNVADELLTTVLLPIGVPDGEVKPKEKKSFNQRAFFNKYGNES